MIFGKKIKHLRHWLKQKEAEGIIEQIVITMPANLRAVSIAHTTSDVWNNIIRPDLAKYGDILKEDFYPHQDEGVSVIAIVEFKNEKLPNLGTHLRVLN